MAVLDGSPVVSGTCDDDFAAVRRTFERNFVDLDELGASVCVIHRGRTVVDLWGGVADAAAGTPWAADTMVVVFSCTKGAVALCAHILASHGELDLDSPVSRYWPAFASGGKSAITVRMLLNHQAGLPGVSRSLPLDVIFDFAAMAELMESEEPLWRPGSLHGYHALTFGWLVGEVVRRVSAQRVGAFFREHVADPLGLDFWIGLPAGEERRVAHQVMVESFEHQLNPSFGEALARGAPIQTALMNSLGGFLEPGVCDGPDAHSAEIPAANGVTNARGLAGMYAGVCPPAAPGLVSAEQLAQMIATESAATEDAVEFSPSRFSAGFEKASSTRAAAMHDSGLVLSEEAFGHSGFGGSFGFVDPRLQVAFAYTMNRHPRGREAANARTQPLIDATYSALGWRRLQCRWAPD